MVKENWFTCSDEDEAEQGIFDFYTVDMGTATHRTISDAVSHNGEGHPVFKITISVERVK